MNIKEIKLKNLIKLELVFENCEVITLYKSDLVSCKLNYYLDNKDYYLKEDSYLIVELDRKIERYNKDYFLFSLNNESIINLIRKRLLENKEHDITSIDVYLNSSNENNGIEEFTLITPDYSEYLSIHDTSVNGISEILNGERILITFKLDN